MPIPRHKSVPGTGFVVDGFRACASCKEATTFFLTHAHGDHYDGLSERWDRPFYCSTITGQLVVRKLGVKRELLRHIDPDDEDPVTVEGVRVRAICANHCPGAVQFLFEVVESGETRRYIHSGDMRWNKSMMENEALRCFRKEKTRILFLDTTYCNPKHKFPDQTASIDYVVKTIEDRERDTSRGRALYVFTSYNIGKERIFLAVHRATGKKLYAPPDKVAHLSLCGIDELTGALTEDSSATNLLLAKWGAVGETWPYFQPNWSNVEELRARHGAEEVIAFVPTGWAYERKAEFSTRSRAGLGTIHLVPYSEHSSFLELKEYVAFIKPEEVVPTVNVKDTQKMLKHFTGLTDESSAKRRFLAQFSGGKLASERKKQKKGVEVEAKGGGGLEGAKVASKLFEGQQELMALTGQSADIARDLLKRSRGDLSLAANIFFDESSRTTKIGPSSSSTKIGKSVSPFLGGKRPEAATGSISLGKGGVKPSQITSRLTTPTAASSELDAFREALQSDDFDPVGGALMSGTDLPYLAIAACMDVISQTKKRLTIQLVLQNLFLFVAHHSPEELVLSVELLLGSLGPEYKTVKFGLGGASVANMVCQVCSVTRQVLRNSYKDDGDLGDVAARFKSSQGLLGKPKPLLSRNVHEKLVMISKQEGARSVSKKQELGISLLRQARGPETKFLVRTMLQCLRIGANRTSVLQALAKAAVIHREGKGVSKERLEEAVCKFEKAYNICPSLKSIVPALIEKGILPCDISVGIPIKPMLAKPSTGVEAAVDLMGEEPFIAEYKYDGQRAQMHVEEGGKITVWSRNLEQKLSFGDACEQLREALDGECSSIVLDCEIVGVERGEKAGSFRMLSFQELSSRPRAAQSQSPGGTAVCIFAFDLMFYNGRSLLDRPLRERLELLEKALPNRRDGFVMLASKTVVQDSSPHGDEKVTTTRDALMASIEAGCEGVMLKQLSKCYEAGRRSDFWIKLKKDYCSDLQDSLDLVPIGAWYGNGRKAGWFSPFLCAVYDREQEEFQSLCRVMSGFSDEFYTTTTAFFKDGHVIPNKPAYYQTLESPSVWFEPVVVWEVRGANITVSPVHQAAAGRVHDSRGLALRFPRFVRARPDKHVEEASGPDDVVTLYRAEVTTRAGDQQNFE